MRSQACTLAVLGFSVLRVFLALQVPMAPMDLGIFPLGIPTVLGVSPTGVLTALLHLLVVMFTVLLHVSLVVDNVSVVVKVVAATEVEQIQNGEGNNH
jgi:hypothetical protein